MSNAEYIQLQSTLIALDDKELQCAVCVHKHDGKDQGQKLNRAFRQVKGCFEPSTRVVHKTDQLTFTRCPGNFFSDAAMFWIEAFERYDKGVLPFPGSLVQQPSKVLDIFGSIAAHKHERMRKQERAQKLRERVTSGRRNQHTPQRNR